MIKNKYRELIKLLILKRAIELGWRVELLNNVYIIKKKLHTLNSYENNMELLLNSLLTFDNDL